jgi:hypothetical protein
MNESTAITPKVQAELASLQPTSLAGSMSVEQIVEQRKIVARIADEVMQDGIHYGNVPGVDKKSLSKSGAEVLGLVFNLAFDPVVEDLSTPGVYRYRVTTKITNKSTGEFLGSGVGECSTDEEKYAWRAAVNENEYNSYPADQKRKKWKKGWGDKPDTEVLQVRTDAATQANTCLKMGKKRSVVDGVLTVTAVSDKFTQDMEDVDPSTINGGGDHHSEPVGSPDGKLYVREIYIIKSGKSDKGPWNIYGIKMTDGITYRTFDQHHADIAKDCLTNKKPVAIDKTFNTKYKTHELLGILPDLTDPEVHDAEFKDQPHPTNGHHPAAAASTEANRDEVISYFELAVEESTNARGYKEIIVSGKSNSIDQLLDAEILTRHVKAKEETWTKEKGSWRKISDHWVIVFAEAGFPLFLKSLREQMAKEVPQAELAL